MSKDNERRLLETKLKALESLNIAEDHIDKIWELRPVLSHIPAGTLREQLETRTRQKKVRYMLFRLRTQAEKNEPLNKVDNLLPGFIDFWLSEKPAYAIDPRGNKIPVPPNKNKHVYEFGGYSSFAQYWDVDSDLVVYLRHSSIWQEWNVTLSKVAPIITDM